MGRARFQLGAAFVVLLLALSLGSLVPPGPGTLHRLPDLRIRGTWEPEPTPSPLASAEDLGPCPVPGENCEVVRSGIDVDGLATWWHRDGTVVKLPAELVLGPDGLERWVPVVVAR